MQHMLQLFFWMASLTVPVSVCRRAAAGVLTEVQWVKGHPLAQHVRQGITTDLNTLGNVQADALATQALRRAAAVRGSHHRAPQPP